MFLWIFQQYVLRLLLAVQEWNFFDLISQTGLQADLKGFTIHLIPETCAALSQGKIVMGQFVRYKTSPCEKEVHLKKNTFKRVHIHDMILKYAFKKYDLL